MRLISPNQRQRRHWLPDAMPSRCCEFVDSRRRRSPPDRASAVPYGQAGENAMRFPHLAHRSAAARKLHSTPQQDGINLISGNHQTSSGHRPLAYSSPEAVQTTGTIAGERCGRPKPIASRRSCGCILSRKKHNRRTIVTTSTAAGKSSQTTACPPRPGRVAAHQSYRRLSMERRRPIAPDGFRQLRAPAAITAHAA